LASGRRSYLLITRAASLSGWKPHFKVAFDASRSSLHSSKVHVAFHVRWSFNNVPLSFFSLKSWKTYCPCKKNQKIACYLLILSYLNLILLIVSNLIYFVFQFHLLTFDFYIKIVLLFYDILGLTLNILISNFDSWLFIKF